MSQNTVFARSKSQVGQSGETSPEAVRREPSKVRRTWRSAIREHVDRSVAVLTMRFWLPHLFLSSDCFTY